MTIKKGNKLYHTRYALTEGVMVVTAQDDEGEYVDGLVSIGTYNSGRVGKDTFTTWPEALKVAEVMRERKIASLRKSIKKLEAMTFKEPV